jgi:hypothetical protein
MALQLTFSQPCYIILSFHLILGDRIGLFPSGLPTKFVVLTLSVNIGHASPTFQSLRYVLVLSAALCQQRCFPVT